MVRLLRKFMGKFVKTKVITSTKITEVDFQNPDNQHLDDNLAVGMGTRTFLHENPDIEPGVLRKFYRSVREFYMEITSKMIKKFPLDDPTLKNLGFVNPALRTEISGDSVLTIAHRFGYDVKEDQLLDEYDDYQLSPDQELSTFVPDITRLDTFWLEMENMKLLNGNKRFPNLPMIALTALSLPHSNADPERCFSMVRKIQTDHRDNLSNRTLNSLLTMKLNCDDKCFDFNVNKDLCADVKNACVRYRETTNKQI